MKAHQMDAIKTLLATLRHEINNPLGAVLGGAFLLKSDGNIQSTQADTLRLIEASGNRIKKVLNQLCAAADLELVTKGDEQMYQIPGDKDWPEGEGAKKEDSKEES